MRKNYDPTMGLEDFSSSFSKNSYKTVDFSISEEDRDVYLERAISDILTDSREDFGYYEGEANRYMTEALATGIMVEDMVRNRIINIRNAESIAKSFGVEAIDVIQSMEDMDDVKDFGKKVWEGIKHAIKKIILAVTNLIKMIGNFIKGTVAKAQEFFYKKYANKLKNKNYIAKENITIKMKAVSSKQCWETPPDKVLQLLSAAVQFNLQVVLSIGNMVSNLNISKEELLSNIEKTKEEMKSKFNSGGMGDKIKTESEKFFASGNKIAFLMTYGVEKPSKHSVHVAKVLDEGRHLLEPGTLQRLSYSYKTAMSLNKMLNKQLSLIDKAGKAMAAGYDKDSKKDNISEYNKRVGSASLSSSSDRIKAALESRRMSQFLSSVIISTYGVALSARMAVFSAAKKIVKKGEEDKGGNNENTPNDNNNPTPSNNGGGGAVSPNDSSGSDSSQTTNTISSSGGNTTMTTTQKEAIQVIQGANPKIASIVEKQIKEANTDNKVHDSAQELAKTISNHSNPETVKEVLNKMPETATASQINNAIKRANKAKKAEKKRAEKEAKRYKSKNPRGY